MRSLRPQSVSVRSGSTPGSNSRRSSLIRAGRLERSAPRSSATGSRMRRLVRPPSAMAVDCGRSRAAASGAQQRFEPLAQVGPVAAADYVLLVDQAGVPRMDDGRAQDALLTGFFEVHGAVVDEHVDVQLDAAGDLVVRAVQVVIGHTDALEP